MWLYASVEIYQRFGGTDWLQLQVMSGAMVVQNYKKTPQKDDNLDGQLRDEIQSNRRNHTSKILCSTSSHDSILPNTVLLHGLKNNLHIACLLLQISSPHFYRLMKIAEQDKKQTKSLRFNLKLQPIRKYTEVT